MQTNTFLTIITRASDDRILVRRSDGGLTLPELDCDPKWGFAYIAPYNRVVQEQLGATATVLRCLRPPYLEGGPAVFVMQLHDVTEPPVGYVWWTPSDTSDESDLVSGHRHLVAGWLSDLGAHPSWTRPDWWSEATRWIADVLARENAQVVGAPEQVKTWSISCVLKVNTTAAVFYFKAVPPLFAQEPGITQALAARYPTLTPEVVAVDNVRHWLLIREFSGQTLRATPDEAETWKDSVRTYANMQVECVSRTDELLACGCAERRLESLAGEVDGLIEEATRPEVLRTCGLSEADGVALYRRAADLKRLCHDLAALGVPDTLLHGDFNRGNIVGSDPSSGRPPLFFDWTDAAVSHPFFDLSTLFDDGVSDGARDSVIDAYLDPWTSTMPRERLKEAVELTRLVAPIYHAVSYRNIRANTARSAWWELGHDGGYFLRMLAAE